MPGDTSLDLTKAILLDALGALDAPHSFSSLLEIPLRQPGKVLGPPGRSDWVQLVFAANEATGGDPAIAARIAASVELFMASIDLFDEIIDGDVSPTVDAAGMPQATNAAAALLLLAQRVLMDVPSRPGLPGAAEFVHALVSAGLDTTAGQHLDLAAEGDAAMTTEGALAIARRKSGALASAACRLGAMVGTADGGLLDLYARWGMHFGTVAQLANDLHDALDDSEKSDIARQKGTLPLLFSRRAATGEQPSVATSGALHFTWVVVEIERQSCRDIADELNARSQGVARFRELVP